MPQFENMTAEHYHVDTDHVNFQILINRYKAHANSEETVFLPLAEKILGRNSNHMAALGLSLHMRHAPHFPSHI